MGPYVTQQPWEGVFCPMPSLPSSASDAVGPQSQSLDAGSAVSDSSMNVQILMGGRRKHFQSVLDFALLISENHLKLEQNSRLYEKWLSAATCHPRAVSLGLWGTVS